MYHCVEPDYRYVLVHKGIHCQTQSSSVIFTI